jgi:two-component system sensor histidine kinase YesM
MIESLQQLIYDNYEANLKLKDITIKKQEAELYALQNQINPHFLFNTLESIRMGLHNKGDDETAVIVLNLSKLFRYSLSWQGELIRLREELELVSRYLSIQKYRFEQKISYRIELPEPLADAWIPRFTVQPVVENAVKHGLESIRENGYLTVRVTTAREADAETMAIVVEDNGAGIQAQTLVHIREALASGEMRKTGSIGLKNVHDRIALHYGAGYGVAVESEPEQGTRVTITIPALYDIPAKKEEPHHVQDTDRR